MVQAFKLPRETYVPRGATRITDKASDAVAFVYVTGKGRPAAIAFHGKAAKPDWHHVFTGEAARERAVKRHFESYRQAATQKAEHRAEAAKPHGLEVGHVLVASWGYDQTNVDFYQVTAHRHAHGRGQGHRAGRREHWPGGMGDGQGDAGPR